MTLLNLSPGLNRVGRACAWIEREDGFVLMTEARAGWTLPGGGIEGDETPEQAAIREAWEEVGAHCDPVGESWILADGSDSVCVPMRLLALERSPEGRRLIWVNPHALPWAADVQLRQVLAARGQTAPKLMMPPLVAQAYALAQTAGFFCSCSEETGQLLRMLAASKPGGRLLELGRGLGAGAAWLHSGMDTNASLLTVENELELTAQVSQLFNATAAVRVCGGDWAQAIQNDLFDLIFTDCALAKEEAAYLDRLINALKPGGLLIMNGFSPPMYLPADFYAGDATWDALFFHPRLSCTEVQVNRRERVVLGTRTG